MKLWLATTDPKIAASSCESGIFAGILTNPSTLAAAGRPGGEVIRDLCAAVPMPVFYQLKVDTVEAMKREAGVLLGSGLSNLGIKVPLTREGCGVLHWLRDSGIALRLATAVPSATRLLLALALDVPWVTPAGSAQEKRGGPPKLAVLTAMQAAIDRQRAATILIPSLSTPAEMEAAASAGIQAGFIWDRDLGRFLDDELTQQIVAGFDSAWATLAARGGR